MPINNIAWWGPAAARLGWCLPQLQQLPVGGAGLVQAAKQAGGMCPTVVASHPRACTRGSTPCRQPLCSSGTQPWAPALHKCCRGPADGTSYVPYMREPMQGRSPPPLTLTCRYPTSAPLDVVQTQLFRAEFCEAKYVLPPPRVSIHSGRGSEIRLGGRESVCCTGGYRRFKFWHSTRHRSD
jgi:hypothetical protein